jgi:uncharacterized protein
MKYLILLGVIGLVLWWLKTQRSSSADNTGNASAQPQAMVRCAHCDVHLPRNDAVQGSQGFYCSAAHLSSKEG